MAEQELMSSLLIASQKQKDFESDIHKNTVIFSCLPPSSSKAVSQMQCLNLQARMERISLTSKKCNGVCYCLKPSQYPSRVFVPLHIFFCRFFLLLSKKPDTVMILSTVSKLCMWNHKTGTSRPLHCHAERVPVCSSYMDSLSGHL